MLIITPFWERKLRGKIFTSDTLSRHRINGIIRKTILFYLVKDFFRSENCSDWIFLWLNVWLIHRICQKFETKTENLLELLITSKINLYLNLNSILSYFSHLPKMLHILYLTPTAPLTQIIMLTKIAKTKYVQEVRDIQLYFNFSLNSLCKKAKNFLSQNLI